VYPLPCRQTLIVHLRMDNGSATTVSCVTGQFAFPSNHRHHTDYAIAQQDIQLVSVKAPHKVFPAADPHGENFCTRL
jgi:hypothetical protein